MCSSAGSLCDYTFVLGNQREFIGTNCRHDNKHLRDDLYHNSWPGYDLASGYLPSGFNGMLAGSGIVFFSFIGFDVVASTAEEVKNPKRDLPIAQDVHGYG
ncbi:unnamed protein product [Linum trigynum]|uniref:Amino acid permease/ SLC12A domain-containing protein n=1 Tax=Linum trigynum TaxID=586398 RepID=A0AAV2E9F0_9ROSI